MATTERTVSWEIGDALPEVLIDYLWELARTEPGEHSHAYILTKRPLGGREVQGILHLSDNGCEYRHKVFGFEPVSAVVRVVENEGGRLYMELAGPLEAIGLAG